MLEELAGTIASRLPEIDEETLRKRLLEREALQSTGIEGLGLPDG